MYRINDDIHDDSPYGFFDEMDDEVICCDNYSKTDQKHNFNLKLSKASSLSSTASTNSLSTSSSYAYPNTIICEIKDSSSSTSCRSFEHSNNAHKSIFVCISMEAFRLIQNDFGKNMNVSI